MLEFSKHEVNIGSIKSSIARIQRLTAGFDKIGSGLTYALSWESIPATALTQCYIVYLIYKPNMFIPSLLCLVALYSLALFPSRYGRVLQRMEADEWLSQGLPFPPPTEEEERRKKEAEEERKRKEEEEEEARKKAEEEEKKLAKLEGDADKNRADREKRLEEKKKKREAEEKKRKEAEERANAPKEAFNWESINPLASLQKQMDEVFAMITMSQNILDEAASCAERVAGILSWRNPGSPPASSSSSSRWRGRSACGGRDALLHQDRARRRGQDDLQDRLPGDDQVWHLVRRALRAEAPGHLAG